MSGAFIYTNTHQIVDGKLDEYRAFADRIVALVRQSEPDMIEFGVYIDDATGEATIFQVHRSVDNFAVHMQLVSELMAEAREVIDFSQTTTRIYGTPTRQLQEQMRQMAGPGTHVAISEPIAAFDRFN